MATSLGDFQKVFVELEVESFLVSWKLFGIVGFWAAF